ncbi:hypothetical protein OKW96_18185 [Sphingobacterium sp. KU25419]|nr:hypothetical protein OKW96_18185 [Sphingobacterium sp. KU25419]
MSVERLLNVGLVGQPVLIGGSSDRGVVASCSYEARRFGVHSAMPMRLALRMCPEAIVVRGDHDLYSKYSSMVTEIIEECTPIVEKASIDEHYLDVTGMDRFLVVGNGHRNCVSVLFERRGYPSALGFRSIKP